MTKSFPGCVPTTWQVHEVYVPLHIIVGGTQMNLENQLRAYSNSHHFPEIDERKVEETITHSKNVLYQNEFTVSLSGLDFLYQQAGFIRKRWWAAQAFVLLILWWLLYINGNDSYTQRWIGCLTPIFVILLFPELWKIQANESLEIEAVSYFSIRRIYAARMLLFAMADILLLTVFFLVSAFTLKLTLAEIIIQFILPMNVTCCICFRCLCFNRTDSGYYAVLLSFGWVMLWTLIILQDKVYQRIAAPIWTGAVLISILYFIYSIHKVWKSCDKYWEVKTSWN